MQAGDRVHVWSPAVDTEASHVDSSEVHALPRGFGFGWLRELNRRLKNYQGPRNILIQYVPHMYGWKSMNLAFCWWIFRQRKHNVYLMFHEVAFPFRDGQRLRHTLLAVVHRMMAWVILRSARHSFTSTDLHLALLRTLGKDQESISLLRICSNIPTESYVSNGIAPREREHSRGLFTVGIFSNFNASLREVLAPAIGAILQNPQIELLLLGPGESFREELTKKFPHAADRIKTTGRLNVAHVGEHMRRCDALLQLYPEGAMAARGTLIGAMASGVPVVSNAGPITDRLLLESNAMLFTDQSVKSVGDAIELLRENPALAGEIGTRAQRLYLDCFEPAVIVSRLRETASAAILPAKAPEPERASAGVSRSS
jgi:glycosyltransferase involved in cell wall biosynthesis